MRTVVDNREVTHLWANRSQAHAQSDNMSFDRDIIKSYAAVIGRHVEHEGWRAVLLADRTWSVTTTRHQSHVRYAIRRDATIFDVIDLGDTWRGPDHDVNRNHYLRTVERLLERARKARQRKTDYLMHAANTASNANAYAEFFGLTWRVDSFSDIADQLEAFRAEQAERQRQAAAEATQRAAEDIERWRAGYLVTIGYDVPGIYLRLRNGEVETTRGARFPVEDAIKAWRLIEACRSAERPWERNGHLYRVGAYQLDSVDAQGNAVAGCHYVEYEESRRLAEALGLV